MKPESVADEQPRAGVRLSAYVMLTLTSLFWGGNAVAGRLAVGEISPMTLTCIRWGIITLVLGIVLRANIREKLPVLRANWKRIAFMGIVGHTVFNGLFYLAAHYTSAMNILILQGAIPALVTLGSLIVFGTRISALQAGGMSVTVIGVLLVATGGDLAQLRHLQLNTGDLLMLAGCIAQAGYYLSLRKKLGLDPLVLFFGMAVAAFLSGLPLLAYETAIDRTFWPSLLGFALLAYVSIFPSVLAQTFLIRGIGIVGPDRAGLFINLVPVFGAGLALVVLSEPLMLYHIAALIAVVSGIFLSEFAAGRTN